MIDVSSYQDNIDWSKVYASGVRRAYIKITEGLTVTDQAASRNLKNAREAGLQVGVYHYAHPSNSTLAEAARFLRISSGALHAGDLPPALDLEVTEGHSWEYVNDWKAQWFAAVDHQIGCRAVFYSYYYFWKQMVLYPDRPVWGAWLGASPAPTAWTFQQYSFTGTVPGISGHVDLDRLLKPECPVIP